MTGQEVGVLRRKNITAGDYRVYGKVTATLENSLSHQRKGGQEDNGNLARFFANNFEFWEVPECSIWIMIFGPDLARNVQEQG